MLATPPAFNVTFCEADEVVDTNWFCAVRVEVEEEVDEEVELAIDV